MSYEHGTPHFNLPQTVGSDTRDWFDTNEAFADIDAAIYSASQTAETAAQDLDGVKSDVQGLKDADIAMTGRVDGIEGRVGASEQAITRLQQDVADVDTDLKDSICAIEEASATAAYQHLVGEFFWYNDTLYKTTANIAVGQQIVPDTNCSTTNITTELLNSSQGGVEIDDNVVSTSKVWSSSKTNTELGTKAEAANVYAKSEVYTKAEVDALIAGIGGSMKCAKYGTSTTTSVGVEIDVSDLNFTSAEDYMVVILTGIAPYSQWHDAAWGCGAIITAKTATSFTVGRGVSPADIQFSYQVISFVD